MSTSLRILNHHPSQRGTFAGPWTETLYLERQGQKRMDESMKRIEASCKASHSQKDVAECADCHGLIVDEMRVRFLGEDERKEWFLGRSAFLARLDKLLSLAKEQKAATLPSAWELVKKERAAWMREELKEYECFHQVALNPVTGPKFERILEDTCHDCKELMKVVKEGMTFPKLGSSDADHLAILDELLKIREEMSDPKETRDRVLRLLIEDLDPSYDTTWLRAPEMESFEFLDLGALADKLREHHRVMPQPERERLLQAAARKQERETLVKTIDEFQRAQAANKRVQQGKVRKKNKRLLAKAMSEAIWCGTCRTHRDKWQGRHSFACIICQVNAVVWGHQKVEVYCSEECMDRELHDHVGRHHACDSGPTCRLLTAQTPSNGSYYLDEEQLLCLECVRKPTVGVPTIFCSMSCAEATLVKHHHRLHPYEMNRLDWEEGKIVPDVSKYLVGVEDLHRERVVPIMDDKDLLLVEPSRR